MNLEISILKVKNEIVSLWNVIRQEYGLEYYEIKNNYTNGYLQVNLVKFVCQMIVRYET